MGWPSLSFEDDMDVKEYWWYKGYLITDIWNEKRTDFSSRIDKFYEPQITDCGSLTCANHDDAKRQIDRITKDMFKTIEIAQTNWIDGSVCLEPCKPAETAPAQKKSLFSKGKKKETKMRYYDEYNDEYVDALPSQSDEAQKREYLATRTRRIQEDLLYNGRRTYGLFDDESPTTLTDLVKRIQDGKFVIPKEFADKSLYDPIRYIKWRDPDMKEDKAGYDDFTDRLSKEVTKTLDVVKIADPADGLKAVQALEQFQ